MTGLSPLDRYRFDTQGFLLFDDVPSPAELATRRTATGDRRPFATGIPT